MTHGLVVVTGADGFIGRALCAHLHSIERRYRGLVRHPHERADASLRAVGDLAVAPESELDAALQDAAAVVHLAGRAHVLDERAGDPAAAYRQANVVGTKRIAQAALRAGCSRFVFASTVKVHGDESVPGRPLRPDDPREPRDDYARSKLAAEREVQTLCAGTRLVPLILRLPLVYGPGVKGNFLALVDAVARGAILPLGAIRNRRSMLYLGNLVEAITAALDVEPAPTGAHFVADAGSVAVPELVRALGAALGEPVRLPRVPVFLLEILARSAGRGAAVQRLTRSLEVDAASFTEATGWRPRCPMAEGLAATAQWWRARHAI